MEYLRKVLLNRLVLVSIALLAQLFVLIYVIKRFNDYFAFFYAISMVVSMLVVLAILNNQSKPAYKIAWLIPILLFPIFGGLFYLFLGRSRLSKRSKKKMQSIIEQTKEAFADHPSLIETLRGQNRLAGNQAKYIQDYSFSPLYANHEAEYLPTGERKFVRLMEELAKAQHYIFLEYYIIEEGLMWNSILQLLQKKVAEGVEVRVIYDDVGCLLKLPFGYDKKLEAMGIKCSVFNPLIPVLTFKYNNRDHRKIAVIDGRVGITGGINLADEYINENEKFGHWKDAAILIKGESVWSLTVSFLTMWDYLRGLNEDFQVFKPELGKPSVPQDGYVQPFSDSPLDDETVGETVYLNMISKAQHYVYITTPYLIIDSEMIAALSAAAKSGVDVRITTPHQGDRWYVHAVTRSYYKLLIENGIKIYEYTPGFVHAKTYVSDDQFGIVGTINMDYRSLYLHFECAVWLYGSKCVDAMKKDFLETQLHCKQITLTDFKRMRWVETLISTILRIFAPLM
jgi:cardiolipin synthase